MTIEVNEDVPLNALAPIFVMPAGMVSATVRRSRITPCVQERRFAELRKAVRQSDGIEQRTSVERAVAYGFQPFVKSDGCKFFRVVERFAADIRNACGDGDLRKRSSGKRPVADARKAVRQYDGGKVALFIERAVCDRGRAFFYGDLRICRHISVVYVEYGAEIDQTVLF